MTKKEIIDTYPADQFASAVAASTSYRAISAALGIKFADKSNVLIRERCEREGVSLDHFLGCGWNKGGPAPNRLDDAEFFTATKRNSGKYLRDRLLGAGVEYLCAWCGISEWRGEPITLEVDHIDGCNTNNVLTNLRLLCPNCHSQTPTFGNRKRK